MKQRIRHNRTTQIPHLTWILTFCYLAIRRHLKAEHSDYPPRKISNIRIDNQLANSVRVLYHPLSAIRIPQIPQNRRNKRISKGIVLQNHEYHSPAKFQHATQKNFLSPDLFTHLPCNHLDRCLHLGALFPVRLLATRNSQHCADPRSIFRRLGACFARPFGR